MILFVGCLAELVAFILLPNASGLFQVLVLTALIGLGMGIVIRLLLALIADTTCMTKRGEIFGIFNIARMSGMVVGPMVAG